MNIIVKKTTELSESEQYKIIALFKAVFLKERTIEHFRNQFFGTVLGYSYHSLLYDDDLIVGCLSFVPHYYSISNKTYLSVLALDNMIANEYRGDGFFKDIFSASIDYLTNEDIVFALIFPNDSAYPLFMFRNPSIHDFGKLSIYALPYRIGGIKPSLKILNFLSIFFVNFFVFLTSLFAKSRIHNFPITKDTKTYNKTRYNQPDGNYIIEERKGGGFVYKMMNYEGIKAAFLVDAYTKSAKNFNIAVKHIIKNHYNEFDILLYVGRLPFRSHGFLKVPQRFAPKNFHFLGQLLKKDVIEADLFSDPNNWDINLSNYDLL